MQIAEKIYMTDKTGLHRLTRALLRPLQSEHLIAVAEREQHSAPPAIDADTFFFDIGKVIDLSRCLLSPTPDIELRLATDIVLPTSWRRDGYISALSTIGNGKEQGRWIQNPNHRVSVWLPWCIGFVNGGNHSISAGILGGEGVIRATEVIDASAAFELIKCDGKHFRKAQTGEIFATVTDHRRAAVFEIGRLLARKNREELQEMRH